MKFRFFKILTFFIFINFSAYCAPIYKLSPNIKKEFWTRYFKWLPSYFKLNGLNDKEKSPFSDLSVQEYNQDFMLGFSLLNSEIIEIIKFNSPNKPSNIMCNLNWHPNSHIDYKCHMTDQITWQKSSCPTQIELKYNTLLLETDSLCYSFQDEFIAFVSNIPMYFYRGFENEAIIKTHNDIFFIRPYWIRWNREKTDIRVYYF